MSDPIIAHPKSKNRPLPDQRQRDLDLVNAEIICLGAEHLTSTGRPVLHVGRCARPDLHDRLVALHVQAKALHTDTRGGTR